MGEKNSPCKGIHENFCIFGAEIVLLMKYTFKLLLLGVVAFVWPLSSVYAQQQVRDVDITLTLTNSGSAIIHERWDVATGDKITEWYLVRENLGDIQIPALMVSDENAYSYEDVGEWDIHRSLEEKAGKCGIVHKDNGVELCWGVGTHGDHVFDAVYGMTRVVKSLHDYDMLHLQLVSPGLSSPPQHVRATIESADFQLDTLNTRLWGFGFEGYASVQDGKAVFESDGPLGTENSVIVLLRFEKGLMTPQSVQDRDFQQALDIALEESDYQYSEKEEDEEEISGIAAFFTALFMFLIGYSTFRKSQKSSSVSVDKLLGGKVKDVPWYRDIPLDGNLEVADNLLQYTKVGSNRNLPMAQILRMIHQGYIEVSRDVNGPARLSFPEGVDPATLGDPSRKLYSILKQAAGENKVLEEKEFSSWLLKHDKDAYGWRVAVHASYAKYMEEHGLNLTNGKYQKAAEEARKIVGLYRYLDEFTLSGEREAFEVHLWKEYLVYASLFGIADKVARQLKDIRAKWLDKKALPSYDVDAVGLSISLANLLAKSLEESAVRGTPSYSYSSSSDDYDRYSGGGGRTSSGGGGGYSGGGRGGGGR